MGNEAGPGLGTRADAPFPGAPGRETSAEGTPLHPEAEKTVAQRQHSSREPNDQPIPREPVEQQPDSWDHEEERSTGVSGHMGYS